MKLRNAILSALLLIPGPQLVLGASESYGFQRIQVTTTTAVGIDSSLISQPTNSAPPCGALVTAEGQSLRFRIDGGLATPTTGHLLTAGNAVNIDSWQDMRNLSMIGQTATSTATVTTIRGCTK
jgi:hypothetical protein